MMLINAAPAIAGFAPRIAHIGRTPFTGVADGVTTSFSVFSGSAA